MLGNQDIIVAGIKAMFRLFGAMLFSFVFVSSPWCKSVTAYNPDVKNYLRRIDNILHHADTVVEDMNLVQYLLHEPIWSYMQTWIGEHFYEPIDGLLLICNFTAFIYAFFLFGRINFIPASIFLFNPMVIDLIMAQIRSAFAMALLLIALMVRSRILKFVFVFAVAMIHSLTIVLLIVYIFTVFLESKKHKISYTRLGIYALFFGVLLGIGLGGGADALLKSVGDRRSEDHGETTSMVYLVYWILLAVILPFISKANRKEDWTQYYSIVLLTLPFVMAIFGSNGVRFVPLSFPIFLYALSMYSVKTKTALVTSLFCYQLIQLYYWLIVTGG